MQNNPDAIIEAVNICKYFGGVKALSSVNFDVFPGEVHALIGENGAGKSTLLKILFGIYRPTSGNIVINGEKVVMSSPVSARTYGMAMIYQEPLVFKELSILENIYMGNLTKNGKSLVHWKYLEEEGQQILKLLGVNLDIKQKMLGLSVAEQQMIEIASALASNARVIFMDEPTASLTPDEVNDLFNVILKLREEGKSIVYVSHRLDEIKKIADRVTILRDGELVGTYPAEEISQEDMIQLMIGRSIDQFIVKQEVHISEKPYFEVQNITTSGLFRDISFNVRKGEVFGIFGLVGAGRSEVACAIFGLTPIKFGEIIVDGASVQINSPSDAIKNGIALVPEDRQASGLFLTKSVVFNSTFAIPNKICKLLGWVDKSTELKYTQDYVNRLKIKLKSVYQSVNELSGGNQQKVSLTKWLLTEPQILILDEPTHGIDIGAKAEVYKIINQLAAEGKCIIMISSELPEILALSDRVMVMYEGTMTALLDKDEINEIKILSAAHNKTVVE